MALAMIPSHVTFVNELRPKNLLVSFAFADTVKTLTYEPELLILDSGAFSAWSQGRGVVLDEYASWAQQQAARFPRVLAVNLDVIPGQRGRTSTADERDVAMAQSLANALVLRAAGLPVMEVFHQDEPADFLRQLVERRRAHEVLGLSPRNDMPLTSRKAWLRRVLALLASNGPEHVPPCHGLAVTARDMMDVFPWWSVDSSTWTMVWRWGEIPHPTRGGRVAISEAFASTADVRRLNRTDHMQLQHSATRLAIAALDEAADEATKLWEGRGITWN
jgi:hypothetical protein